MNERNALLAIHLGALLFGLSGIFGKLAETTPLVITLGRALFAVLALALFARLVGGARGGSPSPSAAVSSSTSLPRTSPARAASRASSSSSQTVCGRSVLTCSG